jgi:hypothetical protein
MRWGLSRNQPGLLDQGESHGPVRHLYLYVAADLYEQLRRQRPLRE